MNRLLHWVLLLLAVPAGAGEPAPEFGHSVFGENLKTPGTTVGYGNLAFEPTEEIPLDRFKKGVIQKATVSSGWLGTFRSTGLSSSYVEVSVESAIPLGSMDTILGITPNLRTDYIHAGSSIDTPNELHQVGVSFFLRRKISDRWSALGIVTPSIRSDFTTSENALRFFGLGLLTWKAVPDRVELSFGPLFLGRADLPVLPAVGLRYTPDTCTVYDIRFPESRFSWRVAKDGCQSESWVYLSGGFGGNTWAVTRADGSHDELSLSYLRLLVGAEKVFDGGSRMFIESGWAFNRSLEYQADQYERSFANAVLFQAGINY